MEATSGVCVEIKEHVHSASALKLLMLLLCRLTGRTLCLVLQGSSLVGLCSSFVVGDNETLGEPSGRKSLALLP